MYREWAPHPAFAGRIACLWRLCAEAEGTQPVVPDGCVDLIWAPGGPQVAGPDTGPHPVRLAAGDVYLGIRFLPGATGAVFGVPVEALRDLRVPLADLPAAGHPGAEVHDPADLMRAAAVRLRRTPEPDPGGPAIAAALRDGARIAGVAAGLGLSERQLHRRCLRLFGYGPKTLQRVVRFQRALRLAREGRPFAQVAVESGFTDQAHMANDVRRLAGVPLGHLLG
ncbi:helix-turn-helix transcriptional regulator [Microtetraspora sp. NBRC 13810]|uniref:helix-turn-helix domain-containing protein n=1 Tax=Microtetraspora sp. NBRC 13810 TaxID=3030990 RepID=UPI0025555A9A|nr:helix-turn-helix transcriptional regulator [Microtetraspora sp. NBRC 13810]